MQALLLSGSVMGRYVFMSNSWAEVEELHLQSWFYYTIIKTYIFLYSL